MVLVREVLCGRLIVALIGDGDHAVRFAHDQPVGWERCALGLPAISLVLADNQKENSAALERAGASLSIPVNRAVERRLVEAFEALASDGPRRAAMSQAAAGLCDGQGAERVAARMLAMV